MVRQKPAMLKNADKKPKGQRPKARAANRHRPAATRQAKTEKKDNTTDSKQRRRGRRQAQRQAPAASGTTTGTRPRGDRNQEGANPNNNLIL